MRRHDHRRALPPSELLAADDAEPWADLCQHPVISSVRRGQRTASAGTRPGRPRSTRVFTGRARYILAAKVSFLDLDDGKSVFEDLHRSLTVADADADAGVRQARRRARVFGRRGPLACAPIPRPIAEDLVAIVREHGHRSAHEGIGTALVLDRQLPRLFGASPTALATHYGIPEEALAHLALPGGAKPTPPRPELPPWRARYLSGPLRCVRGPPGGARGAVGPDGLIDTALIERSRPTQAMNGQSAQGDERPGLSSALRDLARAHRILDLEGHNDMSLGHLSLRDPLGRGLWLKRGNIGLEEVTEADFILIDYDGNVLEGDGIRHLEWPIHAEILRSPPGN